MKHASVWELPTMCLVVVTIIATLTTIPGASWRSSFADPCHVAVVAATLVVVTLVVTRSLGDRWVLIERPVLAAFLAGMPLVYVGSCLWYPPAAGGLGWLGVELAGVPLFAIVALLGMRRPWLLAAGIAAHGLCWDSWHVGRTSFVPDWYAIGCLVVDVTLALYVVARRRSWCSNPQGSVSAAHEGRARTGGVGAPPPGV